MREKELLRRAFAMPLTNPAYPPGPYRFVNREYLIITYRTDPAKLGRECQRCAPQVGDAFIPGMKRGL